MIIRVIQAVTRIGQIEKMTEKFIHFFVIKCVIHNENVPFSTEKINKIL